MKRSESTRPVASRLSFEAYCAELDIDPTDTRTASVVRALHARIARSDAALQSIVQDSQESLKDSA